MARTITTENPARDAARYLRHWGNREYVEGELANRHTGLSRDSRRRKAEAISAAVLQGLELLETAGVATTLTRPLPLFYATENFAKAACVFSDVSLNHSDFRTHGLSGDKNKRYSMKNLACRVNQPGRDVWSHAVSNLNVEYVEMHLWTTVPGQLFGKGGRRTNPQRPRTNATLAGTTQHLGELLRQLPEVAEDVRRAGWGPAYVVWAKQYNFNYDNDSQLSGKVSLTLCHHHDGATKQMLIDRQNVELRRFAPTVDEMDVIRYEQTFNTPAEIRLPFVRSDIFGESWVDFRPGRSFHSETLLYLLGLFILSDVVRYQPDQWKRLLDDHPAETILIDRFLDIGVRKVPNLFLNHFHRDLFLFKVAS